MPIKPNNSRKSMSVTFAQIYLFVAIFQIIHIEP